MENIYTSIKVCVCVHGVSQCVCVCVCVYACSFHVTQAGGPMSVERYMKECLLHPATVSTLLHLPL